MALNRTSWLVGIVALLNQAAFGALDPTELRVGFGQYGGSTAVGPHNTLVTWIDYRRTEDMAHEIFGTRIGPLGETLDGDGIPLSGLASGAAVVATLRNQFLIVWAKGPNIYARRMTSSGELLDPQPITVSAQPAHPYPEYVYLHLTVAADGTNFWVAWTDDRRAPAGTLEYYQFWDIYAARISPAGRVLDPRGIRICGRRGSQAAPRLSPRADFILWSDHRDGKNYFFGARLHPKGFSLDPNGFPIVSSTNPQMTAADVSGNGRGWLVVWGDSSGIHGVKVGRQRAVSAPFMIAPRTQPGPGDTANGRPGERESTAPQVKSAGRDYLVLWQSGAATVGTRVTAAKRVSPVVTLASDPTGETYFSFSNFAGNDSRFCVTGTAGRRNSSWFYNDIWYAPFSPSLLP